MCLLSMVPVLPLIIIGAGKETNINLLTELQRLYTLDNTRAHTHTSQCSVTYKSEAIQTQ